MNYDSSEAVIEIHGQTVPVMTLKSTVSMVKEINEGETVSYGRTFTADRKMRLATVAIGYADGDFDISKVSVVLSSCKGSVKVCENGAGVDFSEDEAFKILSEDEIVIAIDMHDGADKAVAWGCDLTYEYVKINAEYRS